ncbi:rRNA methylase [Leptospira biflexa serovar Patoc strain 'Patoc 1 (Ames)']|uniref:Putative tRNA (cytidine(34)-2'-O)-methyltransferase n=1 Tax=Leptospira biflexa serovar Patoc (strain Patoc 1 / ATCC 23582 / Paris) TaxID=456481 RepID=B0SLR8_LEPBP|nr:tRNA (cytidine(34)-2'-O)-methyltransferase [Leptospira biflexa]ABZ93345.1 rRNA methylase [Leptospira biflexa serovar Patoc strain 'Patoc 1 (Ames)']ABZ96970.1 Putative tRNA/rRNA methyltransferase, TrmH (SpoU) family [Leptospira biflexa serovar Patoc strain 'Patoc 1 (Paris)']TGM38233.1 tRNA (cytidine(34)-2'-O)-methyltransferase [Leptospira biflexa]TGM41564.1 tRNA (cytidine(34)-2'-O)-methyltransferase [Leptospira biflexa]TGM55031.1 tRNA (cytidine(34)-2'-O)-methyltransferase [Leptospira biflexa
MEIALFRPEIPPNTGNIARLCVNAGVPLSIVGEPAFDLSEKAVRRAGLDYWKDLELHRYPDWDWFQKEKETQGKRIFLVSKFGKKVYWDVSFSSKDVFLFGRETSGLPEEIHKGHPSDQIISIPMAESSRSINLSNAVAIILYEALRQEKTRTIP